MFADEAEQCADGADGVAPCASAFPCEYGDDGPCEECYGERCCALEPYVNFVEGVAVVVFGDGCQSVVGEFVEWCHNGCDDAAVGAVGEDESAYPCYVEGEGCAGQHEHCVAQGVLCRRVVVLVLFLTQPCDGVLHDAQWADDGAVDAPHQQGECHDEEQCSYVQRQQCRHKLDFRHPSQIGMCRSGEVDQEPCDEHPEDDGQCQADFL